VLIPIDKYIILKTSFAKYRSEKIIIDQYTLNYNANTMSMRMYNNDMLQPRKLNTRKCAHKFLATTLECNAGQCEVKSILCFFHKRYITLIKIYHTEIKV